MALKQAKQIVDKLPTISASGYEPIVIVGDYTTVAGLTANDVIEMAILPAGYVPLEAKLVCDDIDSGGTPTLTLDIGVVSGVAGFFDNARTCGNEAVAASTVGQAGGVVIDSKAAFGLLAVSDADRGIGVKLAAAAATLVVGARIRLTVMARPALNGA
jgi:hypothetical protein